MYQIRLGNRMFLGLPDPAANRTRVACVAGEHSSKELFEQIVLLLFRTYNMWLLHMDKYREHKLECRLINNKLLTTLPQIALASEAH
jgi:hypothetical protein